MTLTIELYACSEPGTPVACTVPDASLPAGAALSVRLARALELVATRLPRAVEAGDLVIVHGARYFVTTRGFQAVPRIIGRRSTTCWSGIPMSRQTRGDRATSIASRPSPSESLTGARRPQPHLGDPAWILPCTQPRSAETR